MMTNIIDILLVYKYSVSLTKNTFYWDKLLFVTDLRRVAEIQPNREIFGSFYRAFIFMQESADI